MRFLTTTALAIALLGAPHALAGERTVKLSIPGMYCASCPYIVKQAISEVDGVAAVEATIEDRSATVVFDDEVASVEAIRQATADVGYPSKIIGAEGS